MITYIEEDFYKIIQPIIQRQDAINSFDDHTINLDLIQSRDKINLINNLKLFIKSNLSNPSLSMVFSKHLTIIFSQILFKCLDDQDQNVRIAADECINQIIRLTSNLFSPYIIYNLFVELKNDTSSRSVNGALHKFTALVHLIKHSKRTSYVNNVLPVIRTLLDRKDESVLLSLVECLPRIAEVLFPFASDSDIESSLIGPLLLSVKSTEVVGHQRNLSQLVAVTCVHLRNSRKCLSRILRYCVSISYENDNDVRGALFLIKSFLTVCDFVDISEIVFVALRLFEVLESDSSAANKNLGLDCLWHLLQLKNCVPLLTFLQSVSVAKGHSETLKHIDHEAIIITEKTDQLATCDDLTELNDIVAGVCDSGVLGEEETTLFSNYSDGQSVTTDTNDSDDDQDSVSEETSFIDVSVLKEEPLDSIGVSEYQSSALDPNLGTIMDWSGTTLSYIVKLMLLQFLPDCIEDQSPLSYLKRRKIRVNSRVLAINCLSQLVLLDSDPLLSKLYVLGGTVSLPAAIECISSHVTDEDSQLCGSAVLFLGLLISSLISKSRTGKTKNLGTIITTYDYVPLVATIQSLLDNPISGQHLKFILSSVRLFFGDLLSTNNGPLTLKLLNSVLMCASHSYKLVRREVVAVCRCVDFRNIAFWEQRTMTSGLLKRKTLSDKCTTTILTLLSDVEQDVREDACVSFKDLIDHGVFDDRNNSSDACGGGNGGGDYNRVVTSVDHRKLIPFLCADINVTLTDVRRKLDHRSDNSDNSAIHRSMHIIIEQLLASPIPSGKEMKRSLNQISGCVTVLILLHERYPIGSHPQLWINTASSSSSTTSSIKNRSPTSTITRHLLNHCISLLNTPLILMDMTLHTDLLHLISRLIIHGGIDHLLTNDFLVDKSNASSGIVLHLNVDLPLVASIKQIMIHICRMLNVFWHVFQFLVPVAPSHKIVLSNLPGHASINTPKKKTEAAAPASTNKGSTNTESQSSTDTRPPRSRSSLGFFVNQPHYMTMHKALTVAYNSFLISSDSANYSDKLLFLLSKCLESLSIIMEIISFNEVSPYVEEFLSYCSVFYNILPGVTIELIIKLLGSLFGTNLTVQWDPFLHQVYSFVHDCKNPEEGNSDLSEDLCNEWREGISRMGAALQGQLANASISSPGRELTNSDRWREGLFDTFHWVKASGKRREPGILRQMVSTNVNSRPNLSHYIGLFEKHVFQCMRQYIASPPELQTSIIQLLCQLIYLRVNYCQLDSEQKFLNIILNQLENFTAGNMDLDNKSSLITEIIEFLILITYEKSNTNKRDQPILNITQVIHSVESLLLNGISIKSVIIPCLWKIVCDLFVHRTLWLHNPGNFNLYPNANTSNEIEVQREAVLDLLLRKLLNCPETLDVLALIVEHAAREHEIKWEKLSHQVWTKVSTMLLGNKVEFSDTVHIDYLIKLIRVISLKAITQQSNTNTLVDLALKYEEIFLTPEDIGNGTVISKYISHIVQSVRNVVCLQMILAHRIEYWRIYKPVIVELDDSNATRKYFLSRVMDILRSMVVCHSFIISDLCSPLSIDATLIAMGRRLIKMLQLMIIDMVKSDVIANQNNSIKGDHSSKQVIDMDHYFSELKECDLDLLLLWNEFKYTCGIYHSSGINIQSPFVQRRLTRNTVVQMCRHLIVIEVSRRMTYIQTLISDHYFTLIEMSHKIHIRKIFDLIYGDERLSEWILQNFQSHKLEIFTNTSVMMKWLCVIEHLHPQSSETIINLLRDFVISNNQWINSVVIMKIDLILCSRFSMISGTQKQTIITSLKKVITDSKLSFPMITTKLQDGKQTPHKGKPIESSCPIDPLGNSDDGQILDEKRFWRLCVEKSLVNRTQDVRLGPRLLQGGNQSDLDKLFLDLKTSADDSAHISTLPPRFIQQCIRLGFLRSGGGSVVQEGVRVDVIFRLGEKLMFSELSNLVHVTKSSLANDDYSIVDSCTLVGLLAALNNYLSLSCQLSVPMPISVIDGQHLLTLIENVCLLILQSQRICSRILIEELLSLMTVYFCPFTILTDDGMKDLGKDLPWSYVATIVHFIDRVVGQFHYNQHSSVIGEPDANLTAVMRLNNILDLCLKGLLEDSGSVFQKKLRLTIITVARLPCLVRITRHPSNIKSFDVDVAHKIIGNPNYKDVLELDCLSKMNRDDLAAAQTLFVSLGWTNRFMFEETWLIYLNLLHDKGPSAAITKGDDTDGPLSPEEVVEQGHCDSLGLLGLTDMLLKTTARPSPGNPVVAQLEHRPRDKTPNLLHTKIGRKLSTIHGQLDDEIFNSNRGFKMMFANWTISSWNIEREDSILDYRHDQINVNVLAKRISIGSRSPQISGSDINNLDVLSCLQSLPIIYEQWLQVPLLSEMKKSVALWPRACALRSSVILMDLFSSRDQVQWLFDCLLELAKSINIEDDWITLSWLSIGLSKCVAVLETSSSTPMPPSVGKSPLVITTNSIYGLMITVKIIDGCITSDLTILQQSALHSAMFLLQMTVYGKTTWDLPTGSLVELKNLHELIINYLEGQLLMVDPPPLQNRPASRFDVSNSGNTVVSSSSSSLSQAMSTGAANFASTMSGLTSMSNSGSQLNLATTTSSNVHSSSSCMPRLVKSNHGILIRTERQNHLIMATACFYCETYQDALRESDLLENFVTLANNFMRVDKTTCNSATSLLILCRCLERCFLTQRISVIVIDQIIRNCSNYLKTSKSTTHSLPVLRLFLTSCYLSIANSMQTNPPSGVFESVFYDGPSSANGENQLVMLERANVFWKRLTDTDIIDVVESRILSRLISSIMTEFMSGEEVLNKTIHQLLRSWPKAQYVAKTLFDIITRCLNQPEGEKVIRKWTLMVLPSLTSCRPVNLSVWVTTIVLVASGSSSRTSLRAIFSQCLDWLTHFESNTVLNSEMEACLFIASFAFVRDMARDPNTESENKASFFKAIHSNLNIPSFQKLYTVCAQKKLI